MSQKSKIGFSLKGIEGGRKTLPRFKTPVVIRTYGPRTSNRLLWRGRLRKQVES